MANYETLQKSVNATLVESINSSLTFEKIERDIRYCMATIKCNNGYYHEVFNTLCILTEHSACIV